VLSKIERSIYESTENNNVYKKLMKKNNRVLDKFRKHMRNVLKYLYNESEEEFETKIESIFEVKKKLCQYKTK